MAEIYEGCAKQVQVIIHDPDFKKKMDDILKSMMGVKRNNRYTDIGKAEFLTEMRKEFAGLVKDQSEQLRGVIKIFCNTYGVTIPDDGENHSPEVANVLKVIDLCGHSLDADTLRIALEPVKQSGKILKMIHNIINAKNVNFLSNGLEGFSHEIMTLLDEYIGVSGEILEYSDEFEKISVLQDAEILINYVIAEDYQYGVSELLLVLQDRTPYSVLCLADNMMKVGQMYEIVSKEYPRLFK